MTARALGLALVLTITACGSLPAPPVLVGTVGVTVDQAGLPVVLLARCDDRAVEVFVHEVVDHAVSPDEENPLVGHWSQVAAGPATRLELGGPGPAWKPRSGAAVPSDGVVVSVSVVGSEREVLTGVAFTPDDLDAIGSDDVLTDEGRVGSHEFLPVCD